MGSDPFTITLGVNMGCRCVVCRNVWPALVAMVGAVAVATVYSMPTANVPQHDTLETWEYLVGVGMWTVAGLVAWIFYRITSRGGR